MKSYQELVDECKKAYAEKNLELAYELWSNIYDMLDEKLQKDKDNTQKYYEEFHNYMQQFTDDEVYGITDYGKRKAYRQMEIDRTKEILSESLSLYDLIKDEKIKSLDEFLDFYEWCILKSDTDDNLYNIYDLQLNEIVDDDENEGNKTLIDTILRVLDRALSYELDEREFTTDEEYDECMASEFVQNLLAIQDEYIIGSDNE